MADKDGVAFEESMRRHIAASADAPYEELSKDFSKPGGIGMTFGSGSVGKSSPMEELLERSQKPGHGGGQIVDPPATILRPTTLVPDRLSVDRESPYYDETATKLVRVWFKGMERKNVVEYCVSEGWVKLQARDGKMRPIFRKGKHVSIHLQGPVEVQWK